VKKERELIRENLKEKRKQQKVKKVERLTSFVDEFAKSDEASLWKMACVWENWFCERY